MESTDDKHWAQKALIDPLNEPEPFAEDGPGSSFRPKSTASSISRNRSSSAAAKLQKSNNPFRQSSTSSKNPFINESEVSRQNSVNAYPSPPQSASPRKERFSHRQQAFAAYTDAPPAPPAKDGAQTTTTSLRRGSSLSERFPGDKSHRPLDTLKKEKRHADRAPHLRKQHQIRPDPIDKLDPTGIYHHEGPFDATYHARNSSYTNSPLEALAASNEEALKATPRERILDAVERHRPLDGVAAYAPGQVDENGQVYLYEGGENMMIAGNPEGGAYKRWPGIQYHPDDIKGKGEPAYTVEKQLKEHNSHLRNVSNGPEGIEMSSRPRATSGANRDLLDMPSDGMVRRSNTTGERKLSRGNEGGSIRRRFGSIRRSLGGQKDE